MIVMTLLGFYTTRITLEVLGIDNLGIYNVVGGVVGMFALISGSLSASISRHLTFALGKGDLQQLTKTFYASLNIQMAIALIVIIIAEIAGVWFVNYRMNISPDRLFAANIVFQFSLVAFASDIISAPYTASIIAHEKMSAFAFMTIFQVVFKLLLILLLLYIDGDKLILYSTFICVQVLTSQLIYWIYCKKKFAECSSYIMVKDKFLYKELFGFAGWNTIGMSASIFSIQGVNVLLNLYFGTAVNGAQAIVAQLTGVLTQFSNNFMTAVNPQITKYYASDDLKSMHILMLRSTKISFFLFLIVCIPFIFETRTALILWLGKCPEYTLIFTRLNFILVLSNLLSNTLITAQSATGNIRNYQIVVGGALLLNFPLSWIALKSGAPAFSVIFVSIFVSQLCMCLRLWFLKSMVKFSPRMFFKDVYLRVISVSIISLILPALFYFNMSGGPVRFVVVAAVSVVSTASVAYIVGFDTAEKTFVKTILVKFKDKFQRAIPCANSTARG